MHNIKYNPLYYISLTYQQLLQTASKDSAARCHAANVVKADTHVVEPCVVEIYNQLLWNTITQDFGKKSAIRTLRAWWTT